ncbi:ThuA domain-containing protein [Chryseolinea sp. T2]|uniref:ThuA domain-containing protein n=1 Tax=Chryseolinea sp. T2 TaxID=3129255 RepID=UPI0030788C7B
MIRFVKRKSKNYYNISGVAIALLVVCITFQCVAQEKFKVIGFYTALHDRAHITYVHEANKWLSAQAKRHHFVYDSTNNWDNLNEDLLTQYKVVIFLDTRPEKAEQRQAFQKYMEHGGGWIGCHFSAFALNDSDYEQNWDWYHNTFLGSGEYGSNTWRPTSAVLRVEKPSHPAMKGLPKTFKSQPNEWYRWGGDLRKNPDIDVLVSIDGSSFPLGTGPKPHEIWHSGDYPVVWTNKKFRMLYMNMGHNDIDYEGGTNKQLSSTFGNASQDALMINTLLWLGGNGPGQKGQGQVK